MLYSVIYSFFFIIGKKEILHKVNGKFPGRQLTAIMGPSGAGKSTLLDILSGYRRSGVNGAVYVNGRIRNLGKPFLTGANMSVNLKILFKINNIFRYIP